MKPEHLEQASTQLIALLRNEERRQLLRGKGTIELRLSGGVSLYASDLGSKGAADIRRFLDGCLQERSYEIRRQLLDWGVNIDSLVIEPVLS